MIKKISISFIPILLIAACCSSSETSQKLMNNIPAYKEIAEGKYNNQYNTVFNTDSTYLFVCASQKNVDKVLPPPLRFFVYDNKNEKVIFEDNLTNGKIKWINNRQIQVSTMPEIVSGKEENNKKMFGYIYDVINKRKLPQLDKNK